MKKHAHLVILTGLLFLVQISRTQNSYSFSKSTGNEYTDLVNDVTIPGFNASTGLYNLNDFPNETFEFFDVSFTFGGLKTIAIGEYPFLRVDNDSSLIIIDAAFAYIDSIDPGSKKSYLVEGGQGARVLKIQYKNYKFTAGPAGNYMNVQIWYYQQNGVIELHYGSSSANNASGYNIANGPNVGIFFSPDNFSKCYEKLWVNGSPANPTLDSAATLVFKAISGIPPEGSIYKFSPRFMTPPVTTSLKDLATTWNDVVIQDPFTNRIMINGNEGMTAAWLSAMDGKVVAQAGSEDLRSLSLNLTGLNPGLYFLTISNRNGITTKKIIVD